MITSLKALRSLLTHGPFLDFRGKRMPEEALDCPEGTLHVKLSKTLCVKVAEELDVVIEQQLKLDSVRKKLNLLRDIVAGKQKEPPRVGLPTESECVAQILQLLILALPADEKLPVDDLIDGRWRQYSRTISQADFERKYQCVPLDERDSIDIAFNQRYREQSIPSISTVGQKCRICGDVQRLWKIIGKDISGKDIEYYQTKIGENAFDGSGRHWVETDLCSACAEKRKG